MADLQLPGDYGLPATSQLYAGGVKIEDFLSATTYGPYSSKKPKPQISPDHRFWASPPRLMTYPHSEGVIINLAKAKKINYLSLDLPLFPHHFYMFYWDLKAKAWREFKGLTTGTIRIWIDGATPSVVGIPAAYQAKQHPSHYGAGHWIHYDMDIQPVTTTRLRLEGNRNFGSRKGGPKDVHGRPAKYSLGIRNLDFGWRVRTKQDVPRTPRDPDILTENQSFTQTVDYLGSPVNLVMRENRAADLLRGSVWKSEPMPVPYAVVNFYVDCRDSSGNSQTIDRFDVTPLHAGANMNLYYSNDVPDSSFGASDAPIVFPALRAAGEEQPKIESSGILFTNKIGYIDIDNQAIQWNPAKPFWMALEFQPQWASTDTTPHIIFDAGDLQLAWDATGVFRLGFRGGSIFMTQFDFSTNSRMHAVIAYDGERLTFYMPEVGSVLNVQSSMVGVTSAAIRLGAEQGPSTAPRIYSGYYRLNAMVVKQESMSFVSGETGLQVPADVQSFIDDPTTFLDKAQYAVDDDGSTDNALLRYLPDFALGSGSGSVNPHGFLGGPGTIYEDVVWTPVMRDYKLRAGILQFPPTKAKFFKFEFSNLTPEPYETFAPITRKVKTYSHAAIKSISPPQLSTQVISSAKSAGLLANQDAAQLTSMFADTPAITNPSTSDVLPTEALTARDISVQEKLNSISSLYRFDSWQSGSTIPHYPDISKHVYEEVEVGHSKRVAYFVGLSKLDMYRIDYGTDDDTDQYLDHFHDTNNVDPNYLSENIVIGTTNYVLNPKFFNGTTGYTLYTAGTQTGGAITQVNDSTLAGSKALSVAATSLGSTGTDRVGWFSTYATPDFSASVAYSIYVKKITGNNSATLRLNIEYYDSTPALITSDSRSFTPDAEVSPTVLNTNPGFDTDLTGWSGQGGTLVRTTAQYHSGGSSGQITPDGVTSIVRINGDLISATAGKTYRLRGWLRCASARTVNLNMNWYDASSTYLSTTSNAFAVSANTWTYLSMDMVAPANTGKMSAIPTLTGTPPNTDILWADDIEIVEVLNPWQRCSAVLLPPANTASVKVYWWLEAAANSAPVEYYFDAYQIENLRLTDYCDGTLPGCFWNGASDNSSSTRTPINIRPWGWDGEKLISNSFSGESVTTMSRRLPSQRRVRGVQFATQQSGPIQLVPDSNFNDTTLANWTAQGDVITMTVSDDIATTLGQVVRIHRSSALNTWGELRVAYGTYGGIVTSDPDPSFPSFLELEGDREAVGYGGIAMAQPVQVSKAGRVTAAARVYADHALTGPLTLQILSSSGDVLAQQDQTVQGGRIVEWSVGYTIGETPTNALTWADIMKLDPDPALPTYGGLAIKKWADLMTLTVAQSSQLSVRVIQSGSGEDVWYVDNIALFEDPILWEFSNDDGATWYKALDIRNDPNGVLIFPNSMSPSVSNPTGLRWRVTGFRGNLHISALDIRPWYAETTFGMPQREPGVSGGPNIQPTDHYPAIADDPYFKQWSDPIPQDWYFVYRQLLLLENQQIPVVPVTKPTVFANPSSVLVPVNTVPPAPAYLDLYTENYPTIYGVVNSGAGTYNDSYTTETYQ